MIISPFQLTLEGLQYGLQSDHSLLTEAKVNERLSFEDLSRLNRPMKRIFVSIPMLPMISHINSHSFLPRIISNVLTFISN